MNRLKELKELRAKAENLQLDNAAILRKYNKIRHWRETNAGYGVFLLNLKIGF